MNLATEAVNTNGNALENQEKYQESYAAKLQEISTKWQELWANLLNTDGFKSLLDMVSKLLDGINNLFGDSGLAGAAGLTTTAITGVTGLSSAIKALTAEGATAGSVFASLHPVLIAVTAAITVGIGLFSKYANSMKNTREEAENIISEGTEAIETAKENASTIKELAESYTRLEQGVNEAGENIALTEDQFEEYHNTVNQIADMFPDLVDGYDKQNNAIVNLGNAYDQLKASADAATISAYKSALSNLDTVYTNIDNVKNSDTWLGSVGVGSIGNGISYETAISEIDTLLGMLGNNYTDATNNQKEIMNEAAMVVGENVFKELGYDGDLSDIFTETGYADLVKKLNNYKNTLNDLIGTTTDQGRTVMQNYLGLYSTDTDDENYKELSNAQYALVSGVIKNMSDDDVYQHAQNKDFGSYVAELMTKVTSKTFDNILSDIDTVKNKSTGSLSDAYTQLSQYVTDAMVQLGYDANDQDAYNRVAKSLGVNDYIDTWNKLQEEIRITGADVNDFTNLTYEQAQAYVNAFDPSYTYEQWKQAYEDAQKVIESTFDISQYEEKIDTFQSELDTLSGYLSEYQENGFLSEDSLQEMAQEFTDISIDDAEEIGDNIQTYILDKGTKLLNTLGSQAPDTLKNSIIEQMMEIYEYDGSKPEDISQLYYDAAMAKIDYNGVDYNGMPSNTPNYTSTFDSIANEASLLNTTQDSIWNSLTSGDDREFYYLWNMTDEAQSAGKEGAEAYQKAWEQAFASHKLTSDNNFTDEQQTLVSNFTSDIETLGNAYQKITSGEGLTAEESMTLQEQFGDLDVTSDTLAQDIIDLKDKKLGQLKTALGSTADDTFFNSLDEQIQISFSKFETLQDAIEGFMSDTDTYEEYLYKANNNSLSATDIATLMEDNNFMKYYTQRNDDGSLKYTYAEAIERMLTDAQNIALEDIKEKSPDLWYEYQAQLQRTTKEKEFEQMGISNESDALSNWQDTYNVREDFKKELAEDGRVSASTLNSIMESYPNLIDEVQQYMLDDTQENLTKLQEALNNQYNTDYDNYCEYTKWKMEINEDFYKDNVLKGIDVEGLSKKYGVDLTNFKTAQEAKIVMLEKIKELEEEANDEETIAQIKLKKRSLNALQNLGLGYSEKAKTLKEEINELQTDLNNTKNTENGYKKVLNTIDGATTGALDDMQAALDASKTDIESLFSDEYNGTDNNMDWVEILISRIERDVTNLGNTVSATYKSWSKRNTALAQEMTRIHDLISANNAGAQVYLNKFNSINLSQAYKDKIMAGNLSIEEGIDSTTYDLINDAQSYWESYLQCLDDAADGYDQLADAAQTAFDNIQTRFDKQLSSIEQFINTLNNSTSMLTDAGYLVSSDYYEQLITQTKNKRTSKVAEKQNLINQRNTAVANGDIEYGSEQWYSMGEEINSVDQEIQDCDKSLIEFSNDAQNLRWDAFELAESYISDMITELEFVSELLGSDTVDLYEDNGDWKDKAYAQSAIYWATYDTYMQQADDYANEVEKINKMLASDPNNKTLLEQRQEYIKLQQESIQNAEKEKDAVKDLYENGYKELLDYLKEVSDNYLDLLDEQSDLHDYEKNVSDQTENIGNLRKQIIALQGNDSEENKANLQKLGESLSDAEEELQETEYDRWKTDQKTMLDNLYDETEEWMTNRMDTFDSWFDTTVTAVNDNGDKIKTAIETELDAVNYTLSPEGSFITANTQSLVDTYGNTYGTAISNSISDIKAQVSNMAGKDVYDENGTVWNIWNYLQTINSSIVDGLSAVKSSVISNGTNTTTKTASATSSTPVVTTSDSGGGSGNNGGSGNTVEQTIDTSAIDSIEARTGKSKSWWYSVAENIQTPINSNSTKDAIERFQNVLKVFFQDWDMPITGKLDTRTLNLMYKLDDMQGFARSNSFNAGKKRAFLALMKKNGYKTGGKNISDDWAWTQENGSELIRTSDGAILTPVKGADVFTAEQSHLLWDLSKSLVNGAGVSAPTATNYSSGAVVFSGNIVMNGVNDPEAFATELTNAINTNDKIKKVIKANTVDLLVGKNSLSGLKYK